MSKCVEHWGYTPGCAACKEASRVDERHRQTLKEQEQLRQQQLRQHHESKRAAELQERQRRALDMQQMNQMAAQTAAVQELVDLERRRDQERRQEQDRERRRAQEAQEKLRLEESLLAELPPEDRESARAALRAREAEKAAQMERLIASGFNSRYARTPVASREESPAPALAQRRGKPKGAIALLLVGLYLLGLLPAALLVIPILCLAGSAVLFRRHLAERTSQEAEKKEVQDA